MESGPAIFAALAFGLFGAALLVWTGVRTAHRSPVAAGVSPATAAAVTAFAGVVCLALGLWCLTRI
ncbi:hypothetical protein [Streptomyces sp. NPDC058953]|uniref:hypothetical protein n=1 Tax=unclassified Streptomyces TaxID=2593676 RepID=UPI0036AE277D